MSRKQIAKKIVNTVWEEGALEISSIDSTNFDNDNYKKGLYFLLNKKGSVIYVGRISDAKTASLYMRLFGNGSGAHDKKPWFDKNAYYVKFHKFSSYKAEQLQIAERLAIQELRPVFNDKNTDKKTLDKYHNKW